MIKKLISGIFIFATMFANSQVLPTERSTDWTLAGLKTELPVITETIDFVEAGGDPTGVVSGSALLNSIIDEYAEDITEIFFPEGIYFFDETVILPSNFTLNGASANETTLKFDLGGANLDLIQVVGERTALTTEITTTIEKNNLACVVVDTDLFEAGDWVLFIDNDSSFVTSAWAEGSTGQIMQINEISGDSIYFDSPFRRDYYLENDPYLVKLEMKENVSIQNLKIQRLDATDGQTDNISFRYATNCQVKCIESDKCNFGHVVMQFSSNCQVKGSYFYDGHDYGGGGKAYGVVCQFATSECLVTDNNFKHLRHSMLLQAGANGNVYSYNYSKDPFWTDVALPANSAGDLVLHGNYVYANLFEGNIIQNIVIDDSHGINGPHNTFFRNRAELYGIFMNSSPATDSQNFMANEIPNTGFLLGLYAIVGEDHFTYGNNHRGDTKPEGTNDITQTTLYLEEVIPFYYPSYSAWPPIGYPNELNDHNNEALNNYLEGMEIQCENLYEDLGIQTNNTNLLLYPNPTSGNVTLEMNGTIGLVEVYSLTGVLVKSYSINSTKAKLKMNDLPKGVYLIKVNTTKNSTFWQKLVID